ncbi:hypothetical protein [Nocardia sp. BMG51109]|uniref:hypothetical protein n=1 Tax=Nocardia sp. BMG51109 TaxID=1056816 RepID=UPI000466EDCE|nr:hypothetical protein [Nocardia sp. BMG51109]
MFEPLTIGTWAIVDGRCPMRTVVDDGDSVTLVFGGRGDEFEFVFDETALRNLLDLGVRALAELAAYSSGKEAASVVKLPSAISADGPGAGQ